MEHTQLYEDCRHDMQTVLSMEEKYGIAEDSFRTALATLDQFHVVTPIVGKFSTGKSSLLNALLGKSHLGKDYLRTQITPETAIPTEMRWGVSDHIILHRKNGVQDEISLEAFTDTGYRVEDIHSIELILNNPALKNISTVKIVDMPGFDSGIEMHNRAIDDYLPASHAYIIAFDASEPLIADSIVRFLKELKLHDMPVYLVVTKAAKVTETQLAETMERIRSDAAQYLGLTHVEIVTTNAKGQNTDISGFSDILEKIESESQRIFEKTTRARICKEASRTEQYLTASIKKADLSPDELAAEEEHCRRSLERMKKDIEKEKTSFVRQIDESSMSIGRRVEAALSEATGELERMVMNRMDISAKVNGIVRQTALEGLKEDFEPRLHRYLKKITEVVQIDVTAQIPELNPDQMNMDAMTKDLIKEVIKKTLPVILAVIGGALTGPIIGVVIFVASVLVELGFLKKQQNERLQMVREKLRGELIPQIVGKTEDAIRSAITEQMGEINQMIENEAKGKIAVQEKALADLRESREKAAVEREARLGEMRTDLAAVQKLLTA